jgi:hypothetical protein
LTPLTTLYTSAINIDKNKFAPRIGGLRPPGRIGAAANSIEFNIGTGFLQW